MKAAASPGETRGEVSEIAAKVAGGGGGSVQGPGEDVGTFTYFKAAFWVGGGECRKGAHGMCILWAVPDIHAPGYTLSA